MLSLSDVSSPNKKPNKPPDSLKPNSLHSALQLTPKKCLVVAVFFLQILLLLHLRSLPFSARPSVAVSLSPSVAVALPPSASSAADDDCDSSRIFVYDIPKTLNQEILDNCDNLNPWSSTCDALSNSGFGRRAAELSGLIPDSLVPAWFWTDQFTAEVIFHNRILSHKCRVTEPESATAFYIPFYAGLAVGKYLWPDNRTVFTDQDRDRHCEAMLTWLEDQPYYKRSNGWDHFIPMGRITWDFRRSNQSTWGSSCMYKPGMRNVTRLLIERNPWDYFDVGVPYPTGFHPRSVTDVTEWQDFVRNRNRSALYCFAGGTRRKFKDDFRGLLLGHCRRAPGLCRLVDCAGSRCSNGSASVLEMFLGSEFCLQPRGDSFTRRSIFDCMVAGSIPVFFWKRTAYYQYEWFLPTEPRSYSVYIDRVAVKNGTASVKEVLESYSEEEKRKMREKVIEYIPRMVYSQPREGLGTVKDAFDIAIDGVFRRFKEQAKFQKW